MGLQAGPLDEAMSYALIGGGSGVILKGGRVVLAWGSQTQLYDVKSTTKSIGATAAGLAIADGLISLDDLAQQHLPGFGLPPDSNHATGWLDQITLRQLATHTAGFAKQGGYIDLTQAPGTMWSYSDGGLNWFADVLTQVYREDLNALLFRRVFSVLGIDSADLVWRSNAMRDDLLNGVKRREFGSGIRINVDAMARIGYLYLRNGTWNGSQILPAGFVDTVRQPQPAVVGLPVNNPASFPEASNHYGVAWFTNTDGTLPEVPTDAYWGWGLRDSVIAVIPSLDIVAVRAGNGFGRDGWNADYAWIAPFLTPIARSAAATPDPTHVVVPDLVGLAQTMAEAELAAAGLVVGALSGLPSDQTPVGHVVSHQPTAGSSVSPGTGVSLAISTGVATTESFLAFDGRDDVMTVKNSSSLRVAAGVTVEARVRPRSLASNKLQDRILRKGTDYELMVSTSNSGCSSGTQGHLQLSVKISGTVRRICGGSLALNQWQHVAGTFNGSTLAIYLDGALVASASRSGSINRGTTPLTIGNQKSLTRPFDGAIDDPGVWNRALSPTEVAARTAGQDPGSMPGLVAFWPLNDGGGQAVRDVSTSGNQGTLGLTTAVETVDPVWAP
jgi:CubicO group peptidase (beta-lactamase class C family)